MPCDSVTGADSENDLIRELVKPENEANWPMPVCSPLYTPRIVAQQGVFTCQGFLHIPPCVTVTTIMDQMSSDYAKNPEWFENLPSPPPKPDSLLLRIRLPNDWRPHVLQALDRMNICPATLFPGLDGVGADTRLHLELGTPQVIRDCMAPGH